jgi:hypothetical protein
MSKKTVRQVLRLVAISLVFGVYASEAAAQSIQSCEFQLSNDQYPCAPGAAGWPCREAAYPAFNSCLSGVFPDQVAADPEGFCTQAQINLNSCWSAYENCGGFYEEGCWEAYYYVCRAETGIDYCQ